MSSVENHHRTHFAVDRSFYDAIMSAFFISRYQAGNGIPFLNIAYEQKNVIMTCHSPSVKGK